MPAGKLVFEIVKTGVEDEDISIEAGCDAIPPIASETVKVKE